MNEELIKRTSQAIGDIDHYIDALTPEEKDKLEYLRGLLADVGYVLRDCRNALSSPSVDVEANAADFEAWLKSVCFQAPPEHCRELAESAWKAALRQLPGVVPEEDCKTCKGSGVVYDCGPEGEYDDCYTCHGTGKVSPTPAPAHPAPGMEWISVKDRLPSHRRDVLVFCGDTNEQFAAFHKGNGEFQYGCYAAEATVEMVCRPSHWMPLPASPATDTEGGEA